MIKKKDIQIQIIKFMKKIGIGIIGLGNIGSRLYKEIISKKKGIITSEGSVYIKKKKISFGKFKFTS